MKMNMITDSCCDMTLKMQKENNISVVPLTTTMDDRLYCDDENLDMENYLSDMKKCSDMTSGAPSPYSYLEKIKKDCVNFVVTLSSKLSGSYSSANAAKALASEDNCDVHVFDSKSASAGQMLAALRLKALVAKGERKEEIIKHMDSYISKIKTYFAAQDLGNFVKSGRLSNIKGRILTVLGINPILSSDGDGNLMLLAQSRGENRLVAKLIELIKTSGKETDGDLVITHCENPALAQKLKARIESTFAFKNIYISHTRGLSSMYVSTKGIVVAF